MTGKVRELSKTLHLVAATFDRATRHHIVSLFRSVCGEEEN